MGPGQNGDDLFDFGLAPDRVGQFSQARKLREIAALLVQHRCRKGNWHVFFRRYRRPRSCRLGFCRWNARRSVRSINGGLGALRGGTSPGQSRRSRVDVLAFPIERVEQLLRRRPERI